MKWVRIENNKIAEIIPTAATTPTIAHWYGEEFASQCVQAPDWVFQGWDYVDGTFYEKYISFDDLLNKKLAENSATCKSIIYAGFDSSAKGGVVKHYRFNADDQINIMGNTLSIMGGATTVLWKNEDEEICSAWSAQEFTQLVNDATVFKTSVLHRQDIIKENLKNCSTVDQLNAVDITY